MSKPKRMMEGAESTTAQPQDKKKEKNPGSPGRMTMTQEKE